MAALAVTLQLPVRDPGLREKINGTTHLPVARGVDQHGNVLDILVQSRRNAVAAKRLGSSTASFCLR